MARKKRSAKPAALSLPLEDRRAEAVTVAWMLCTVFTFCAEALGLAARLYFLYGPEVEEPSRLALLPYVTLGIGVVSGTICLLLTPLVYRLRKTPPPTSVTLVAVLIGLAPLATVALQWLRG